jgi:NDP-sugar pyrophosphorylase family protein
MSRKISFEGILDSSSSLVAQMLLSYEKPWQILPDLKEYIRMVIRALPEEYIEIGNEVFASSDAKIDSLTKIEGPTIIDKGAEIRFGAHIRGGVIVGKKCVVGSFCEIKNSVLFDHAKAPHLNYVGDSILGYYSHLGAGVILSNQKSDKSEIVLSLGKEKIPTGLFKMGAIIGDFCEIGCGSVLNPGTVIGKNTTIYPLSSVRGFIPKDSIYKSRKAIVKKHVQTE